MLIFYTSFSRSCNAMSATSPRTMASPDRTRWTPDPTDRLAIMFEEIERLRSSGTPQEMKFAAALFDTTPQTGKHALISLFEETVISYREADRTGSAMMIMTAIMAYVLEHEFLDLQFAADIAKVAIDHPIISCNRWLLDMTTMFNAAVVAALHSVTPELLPSSGSSSMCYSVLAAPPSPADEIAINTLHNALCDLVSLVRRTRRPPGTWSEILEETVLALVCSELRCRMLMHSNHLYVLYRPLSIRPIHFDVADVVYRSYACRSRSEYMAVLKDVLRFETVLRESIASSDADAEPAPSPANTEPAPSPANTEPAPSPADAEPAPSPANTEPAPSPATTEPAPSPADAEPAPSPANTEPVPSVNEANPSSGSAVHVVVEVTDEVRAFAPYPGMPDLPPPRAVSDGISFITKKHNSI